jgi:hypothetical protein
VAGHLVQQEPLDRKDLQGFKEYKVLQEPRVQQSIQEQLAPQGKLVQQDLWGLLEQQSTLVPPVLKVKQGHKDQQALLVPQ